MLYRDRPRSLVTQVRASRSRCGEATVWSPIVTVSHQRCKYWVVCVSQLGAWHYVVSKATNCLPHSQYITVWVIPFRSTVAESRGWGGDGGWRRFCSERKRLPLKRGTTATVSINYVISVDNPDQCQGWRYCIQWTDRPVYKIVSLYYRSQLYCLLVPYYSAPIRVKLTEENKFLAADCKVLLLELRYPWHMVNSLIFVGFMFAFFKQNHVHWD